MKNKSPLQRYCIKPSYMTRLGANIRERSSYWTEQRIITSHDFQYYVYQYVQKLLKHRPNATVLDVGSGPGVKIKELIYPLSNDITLIDHPSTENLCKTNCPMANFIGCDLETPDIDLKKSYDLIICSDVLEHLIDPDLCLAMIKRHMHSSTLLILSTPDRDILYGEGCDRCVHGDHVREWNKAEFDQYIQSVGLEIIDAFHSPQMKLSGVDEDMLENQFINYCGKLACYSLICKLKC